MRYIPEATIIFTDKDGNKIPIKENREIPVYTTTRVIDNLPENIELDELASQAAVYGEGAEWIAYALFDHNIERITEANFDLTNMKTINVPNLDDVQ